MKTFGRLIRRYVLAAVGMVLVLAVLCVGFIVWLGWRESTHTPQAEYSSGVIADAMVQTAQGLAFGPEHTPEEWMDGYAWAMVLDDDGDVVWSYALPEHLARRYTPADVARFARWYLDDYPVFCWTEDYGLFVIAMPQGSIWKYNLYNSPQLLTDVVNSILPAALCLLALGLAVCLLVSGRGAKQLRTVAAGLDALAEGQPVQLPTDGFAGEVAEKLNQTSAHLQKQGEMLARRDTARTQWISLQSMVETTLLQKEQNGGILLGREHMMFPRTFGLLSSEERTLPKNTSAVESLCQRYPGKVNVLLAPAASDIYPENVPANAPLLDENNYLDPLSAAVQAAGGRFVDVRGTLTDHKGEYLYYRTDHHWTSLGAYYAYQQLCTALGLTPFDTAAHTAQTALSPKTTSSTLSVAIQRSNCNGLASRATSLHGKSCMSQAMPLPPVSLVKWCRVWKGSSAPSGKALRRWASVA